MGEAKELRLLDRIVAEELVKDSFGFFQASTTGTAGEFEGVASWDPGRRSRRSVRLG
jgi:hypothetical protein